MHWGCRQNRSKKQNWGCVPCLGFRGSFNSKPCSLVEGTYGKRGHQKLKRERLGEEDLGLKCLALLIQCHSCPPANCVPSAPLPWAGVRVLCTLSLLQTSSHALLKALLPSLPARVSGLISASEGRQFLTFLPSTQETQAANRAFLVQSLVMLFRRIAPSDSSGGRIGSAMIRRVLGSCLSLKA